ncbi:MAG: msbA, partial [Verrucomicrobiaceae bacterium]|nr:msbA [Verrucomicrobiaceae bacterium]
KSTIINLLTRFYEHDEGSLTIDGTPVKSISKSSLRKSIGYVTQESFLFNGSVRDNLIIGKRTATDAELWEALKSANADEFVNRLPKQLDTHVGERGIKLSVGEKQRISIARALLRNPPILLLDEATASVDTETERQIQQALERLMKNRTSFVIAHRLSTVRNADRIYVLDHGRIIEQGTHDTLIDAGGMYSELCRSSLIAAGAN